jgi:phosphoserine phosphatase
VTAHVFDMDGTLIHQTSGAVLLAAALGHSEELMVLEQGFTSGTTTTMQMARELWAMWGVVDPEIIEQAFRSAPVLDNVEMVLDDIHARGEHACLITMSPGYFAERFLETGFDAVFASSFPTDASLPLDETRILTPADKPRLAAQFCEERGLTLANAVAYGDSLSDVFLFREAGIRIAVNATHHLSELADASVQGTDLLAAYRAARDLLAAR